MPITWRNTGAPSFASTNQLAESANRTISDSLQGFSSAVGEFSDRKEARVAEDSQIAANNFANQLRNAGSEEEIAGLRRTPEQLEALGISPTDIAKLLPQQDNAVFDLRDRLAKEATYQDGEAIRATDLLADSNRRSQKGYNELAASEGSSYGITKLLTGKETTADVAARLAEERPDMSPADRYAAAAAIGDRVTAETAVTDSQRAEIDRQAKLNTSSQQRTLDTAKADFDKVVTANSVSPALQATRDKITPTTVVEKLRANAPDDSILVGKGGDQLVQDLSAMQLETFATPEGQLSAPAWLIEEAAAFSFDDGSLIFTDDTYDTSAMRDYIAAKMANSDLGVKEKNISDAREIYNQAQGNFDTNTSEFALKAEAKARFDNSTPAQQQLFREQNPTAFPEATLAPQLPTTDPLAQEAVTTSNDETGGQFEDTAVDNGPIGNFLRRHGLVSDGTTRPGEGPINATTNSGGSGNEGAFEPSDPAGEDLARFTSQLQQATDQVDTDDSPAASREIATEFIKDKEAFRNKAYPDGTNPDGSRRYSIGYGTKAKSASETISEEGAVKKLEKAVKGAEDVIKSAVKVPLNTQQKAAVTSLIYNVGPGGFKDSIALRLLNNGDFDGFMREAFSEESGFVNADGKKSAGLVNRRNSELALFTQ